MYNFRIIKIGRDPNNDIVIDRHSISRNHLEVFINEEGTVFVTDLNSSNGTFINGNRISGTEILHPGDILRLGVERPIRWQNWLKQLDSVKNGESIDENNLFESDYRSGGNFISNYKIPLIALFLVVIVVFIISRLNSQEKIIHSPHNETKNKSKDSVSISSESTQVEPNSSFENDEDLVLVLSELMSIKEIKNEILKKHPNQLLVSDEELKRLNQDKVDQLTQEEKERVNTYSLYPRGFEFSYKRLR